LFNFDDGVVASFVFVVVVVAKIKYLGGFVVVDDDVDDDVDVTTDGWVTNTAPENGDSRGLLVVNL